MSEMIISALGALVLLIGAVAGRWIGRREGHKQGEADANERHRQTDAARAADIRARVDRHRDDLVRKLDDAGYRD